MITRWFLEHPRSVGETYLEHLQSALGFAGVLTIAALACTAHALAPAIFQQTGSRLVKRLYDRMLVNRRRLHPSSATDPQPWADYAI